MADIKWYKRDPDAALSGMFELTLEERGAYNTVLDLIYSRANNLPDDDRWISGWMRCDVRVWKRIKTRLVECGKLYIQDNQIRNNRADVEVLSALSRVASARDAGLTSARSYGRKSERKSNKNNDVSSTSVDDPLQRPSQLSTTTPTTIISPNGDISPKPPKKSKWTTVDRPDGVSLEVWQDFENHRKAKCAPITATVISGFQREALKIGWTLEASITESIERGWHGFKAEWIKGNRNGNGSRNSGSRDGFFDAAMDLAGGNDPRAAP